MWYEITRFDASSPARIDLTYDMKNRLNGRPCWGKTTIPSFHERHINLLGRYSFAVPEAVTRGELRPLRDPSDADA
ncbi:hypothetical protein [Methylobacter sp.]|uniref:hypothetical protein n=1 Tax=Methylobacter sp. TaxID=2051955 RepID=UPI003DA544D4